MIALGREQGGVEESSPGSFNSGGIPPPRSPDQNPNRTEAAMLALITPAKRLDTENEPPTGDFTIPHLLDNSEELVDTVKRLGKGRLKGFVVACPWHFQKFDIRTGMNIFFQMHNNFTFIDPDHIYGELKFFCPYSM